MDNKIDEIIKQLSLKEKVAQLNQRLYGWQIYEKKNNVVTIRKEFIEYLEKNGAPGSIYGVLRADPWSKINFENGLTQEESKELLEKISQLVASYSSQNIHPFFIEETPHGHQGLNAVMYPTNIAIGASFNPELYGKMINEIASYMEALNVSFGLFSGLDICRNPKWGRTEECFGEDPVLANKYLKEIMHNTESLNFNACLKHFAAQGDPYLGLNSGSVNIGPRELIEIHLKAMDNVAPKAKMIMAAYNEIDGVPCHINKELLQTTLREKLQFNGIILADGCALDRLVSSTTSAEMVGNLALSAGIDLSLWDDVYTKLEQGVEKGIIDEKLIDKALYRIIETKIEMGLIGDKRANEKNIPNYSRSINDNVSYNLAVESVVMLENKNQLLPLNKNKKILLVGECMDDLYYYLGDYTAIQEENKYDTIKSAMKKEGFETDYCQYEDITTCELDSYDVVIVGCGGSSKRNFDMSYEANGAVSSSKDKSMECGENADVSSVAIKKEQYNAIKRASLSKAKVCALFVQGRSYSMEGINEYCDAILLSYYGGVYTANAITDIISGKVSPSGKNPLTILNSSDYSPYAYNNKKDFRREKYINSTTEPVAYGFGYGMSYAQFTYHELSLKEIDENTLFFVVEVSNTSNITAKEVIQLYVEKENSIITKRKCELLDFYKVEFLPYERKKIEFIVDKRELATYYIDKTFVLEDNLYQFFIGTSTNRILKKEWKNEIFKRF